MDITDKILKRQIDFPPLYKRLWIAFKTIIKFGFKPIGKRISKNKRIDNIITKKGKYKINV